MKTLSSVILVLAAAAVPAFADSTYFLPTNASPTRAAVSTASSSTSSRANTDRVSVTFRPMTRAVAATTAKLPMVFVDRRYTRGSAQAAIVR
jgi:hypothetical protein